jgi:predicted ATPase
MTLLSRGHVMIEQIDIRNFKCFRHLRVESCSRINVIVGDNGSGKTALLEAIFWALASTSELAIRYRQHRGIDGAFTGSPQRIEEAIWRDYFYEGNWTEEISVELKGTGLESRSVRITRGSPQVSLSLSGGTVQSEQLSGAISIVWRDSNGIERSAQPKVGRTLEFTGTNEDLSNFFYFPANANVSSTETATRFSELSRARRAEEFIRTFTKEYAWIEDLKIEAPAGAPIIYATIKGRKDQIPLPNVSSGINRVVGVLVSIASQTKSVVLVDELEDGIYYKHHEELWRTLLHFSRTYETQLFITTHSAEWLKALVIATGNDINDIALWRIERGENGRPELFQFEGIDLKAGIEYGAEVRGGSE